VASGDSSDSNSDDDNDDDGDDDDDDDDGDDDDDDGDDDDDDNSKVDSSANLRLLARKCRVARWDMSLISAKWRSERVVERRRNF